MFANKLITMFLVGLVAFGLMSPPASAAEYKQGVILGFHGAIVVVGTSFEQTGFLVSSSTLVTLNGRPARVNDLSAGDFVTVMYVIQGGNTLIPQRIEAMRVIPY